MELKDVLDEKMVCMLGPGGKKESILKLISMLKSSGKVRDVHALEQNIFHREKLMSTGIGLGLAVPHTRMEGISHPVMVVGVSRSGVKDYESIDGEAVRLLVLIVCGSRQHKEYISLLSALVNMLKSNDAKQKILSAESPAEIFKIMRGL